MKTVYLLLNWVFGIFLLLLGLISIISSFLAGLSLLAIAALLLPPVRSFVHSKTKKELPVQVRAIAIVVLLITFTVFSGNSQDEAEMERISRRAKAKAEMTARLRQENKDYFESNREKIISSVKNAFMDEDYQKVVDQSKKYLFLGDKELLKWNEQAKKELADLKFEKETKRIIAEINEVPSNDYQRLKQLYEDLSKMYPDNEDYKKKINYCALRLKKEKERQAVADAREESIDDQFSKYDGSHRNLTRFIKENMNDPDSYDHVKTVYWDRDDYLIVETTFRGKNAFGAVVKNSVKAKVSLEGEILQIISQN